MNEDVVMDLPDNDEMESILDDLLCEFGESDQNQIVKAEASAWKAEEYRAMLSAAGDEKKESPELSEARASLAALKSEFGVEPEPLTEDEKSEILKSVIGRYRADYQRLTVRARIQAANKNERGLKATEEFQARIRDAVRRIVEHN